MVKWRFWQREMNPDYEEYLYPYCRCCGHKFAVERQCNLISVACVRNHKDPRPKCLHQDCSEYAGRCRHWYVTPLRYRWIMDRLIKRVYRCILHSLAQYGNFVIYYDSFLLRDYVEGLAVTMSADDPPSIFFAGQDYAQRGIGLRWEAQVVAAAPTRLQARKLLANALANHVSPYDPYNLERDNSHIVELNDGGFPRLEIWDRLIYAVWWENFITLLKAGTALGDMP